LEFRTLEAQERIEPIFFGWGHKVILGFILLGTAGLIALSGCTGESIRMTIPERHPANPAAAEAPFSPPSDPFAAISDSVSFPGSNEPENPHHGHSSHDRNENSHHGSGQRGMPGGAEGTTGKEGKK
jgi:hypothetical protein